MKIFVYRRVVFVVLVALLFSTTPSVTPPAFAINCGAITGGSVTDNGDGNWLLSWNPLADTSDIAYLIVFATSGVGYQSWYNNGDGYTWTWPTTVSPSASTYLISKSSLISFMNTNGIDYVDLSVRKDNPVANCNPLTSLGQVRLLAAPAFTLSSASETTNAASPIAGYTINSTGGAIANYSISPAISNGLSFSTSTGLISGTPTALAATVTYTITATNATGTANATFSLTVNADPAIAAAAAAARLAEIARLASEAESARRAKEQKEITELLSLVPVIAGLSLSLGELTFTFLTREKCVKDGSVRYVKQGTNCAKGYVKKR